MRGVALVIEVALITVPSPDGEVTGGHLYDRELGARAERHGFHVRAVPLAGRSLAARALAARRALRDLSADVVVVDSIVAAPLALAPRTRHPLVGLCHQRPGGAEHSSLARLRARLDARTYQRCEFLVAVSEWLAAALVPLGVPVTTVPPGCDVADTAVPPAAGLRGGRAAAIACVANWSPHKGVLDLIEAVARLPDETATLHLIGAQRPHSQYGRTIARRVARDDVRRRIVVHGTLDRREIAAVLSGADLFALPSRDEAFGIAVAEALFAGLPIVGYRSGNLPDLVRSGTGLLVETGEVEALAWALFALAMDGDRRAAAARAARERAVSLPTWDASASAFFAALRGGTRLARPHHDGRDRTASTA